VTFQLANRWRIVRITDLAVLLMVPIGLEVMTMAGQVAARHTRALERLCPRHLMRVGTRPNLFWMT